jgi:hypothetical protein
MKKSYVEVKRTELVMIELKNPIKIFKFGKLTSPQIPLVMKIIILFWLEDGNFLVFHWTQKFSF